MFVGLPFGLQGFVDVISLPRDENDWPAEGVITQFEILQHRDRQIRLWPLDPRYDHDDPCQETAWQRAKARHPVGSIATAEVTGVFPANHEYLVRLWLYYGTCVILRPGQEITASGTRTRCVQPCSAGLGMNRPRGGPMTFPSDMMW